MSVASTKLETAWA